MTAYYFAIHFEGCLFWQFSLKCEDDADAKKAGTDYMNRFLKEDHPDLVRLHDDFELTFCELDAWINSLEFRGRAY